MDNSKDTNADTRDALAHELEELKRKVKQLERDNRMLAIINQNAEQLRLSYEAEKNLQYLYNDLLLENCPNMMFLFNEMLRFVIGSKACSQMLCETNRDFLLDLPFSDIFSNNMEPQWVQKMFAQCEDVLCSQAAMSYDDAIKFRDGTLMFAQVAISPIVEKNGRCLGVLMTINDTTELVRAKRRAEEAAHSKSNFLANMSHEIRTPMNAVKGLSELLALTELTGLQRNYVNNIISSSNSLLGIINDVLDFSKIDAHRIEIIEGEYQISELISGVCNIVNMRADEKDIAMQIDADPLLPARLIGDEVRIKQVITNLLSNAVKYTEKGIVRLILRMEETDGQHWLSCAVQDTGIGIQEESISELFDAFSRLDILKNRSIAGTGLGLAISKQLAEAMHGELLVESIYGQGSTFTFRIPQGIADDTPIAYVEDAASQHVLLMASGKHLNTLCDMLEAIGVRYTSLQAEQLAQDGYSGVFTHCIFDEHINDETLRALRAQYPDCKSAAIKDMQRAMEIAVYHETILYLPLFITDVANFLNKKHRESDEKHGQGNKTKHIQLCCTNMLVVDDNEINLVVSGELLRSYQADVDCVESGEEAIRVCAGKKYDMIFMDHMMPGMDGVETTQRLRSGAGLNNKTPIIALTANVVNGMEKFYLQNGMDDFIGKPVEMVDLERVLRKWLPEDRFAKEPGKTSSEREVPEEYISQMELIAALDSFGLYTSDVMREIGGDFEKYIQRMEYLSGVLEGLVAALREEVSNARLEAFAADIMTLRNLLHGIGARDCAGRARQLAVAACEENIEYIHEDFFPLMDNMYMLEKKLKVIIPLAHGGSLKEIPLNAPQYLYGSLEKMGRMLQMGDAVQAMACLEKTATFSLNKDLDGALKEIKTMLERGDFDGALRRQIKAIAKYAQYIKEDYMLGYV